MTIRVLINGAFGKMGRVTQAAIQAQADLELVASLGRENNLGEEIVKQRADVVIDFTLPEVVFNNTKIIIASGARPVIGTSGLTQEQIAALTAECKQKKIGGIIAPNFSLGAILMMRYAADAIKYLPHAEIIEMHHEKKVDAPSGTAVKTRHLMGEALHKNDLNIPIHSVRLPGLFAHQMVIFGGQGETLTIKHDSTDRNAMMPGVCLACRKVMQLDYLMYGLDQLLE